jgi:hypothetical protein
LSFIDRVFVGKVIRDFGAITETNLGIGRQKLSLILVERRGKRKLVFKSAACGYIGFSISYMEIPADALPILRQWFAEAAGMLAPGGIG